jgi:hypothetical protein
MRQQHRLGLGIAACLATVTLGGCDNDSNASDKTDALTPPGTELKLGETATVPLDGGGIAKFTVNSIDKANPADLANVKSFDPKKLDAYYIRYDVTVVSEHDAGVNGLDLISDIGLHGSRITRERPLWEIKGCHVDRDLLKHQQPGDTFTNCLPTYLAKDQPMDGVHFSDPDSPYYFVDGQPVIWRP